MKEACSTRVPEDSYPPPSSPGSRKLPAAFPGAFLPILPRSRFFRRHQKQFLFTFFLPIFSPKCVEKRAWPRALPGPACTGCAHLRQEGQPREVMGCRDGRKGHRGLSRPTQSRTGGVCPHKALPQSRCCPGLRRSALRSQVGRGGPRLSRDPPPQKHGRKEEERVPIPTLHLQCRQRLNTV